MAQRRPTVTLRLVSKEKIEADIFRHGYGTERETFAIGEVRKWKVGKTKGEIRAKRFETRADFGGKPTADEIEVVCELPPNAWPGWKETRLTLAQWIELPRASKRRQTKTKPLKKG